MIFLCVLFLTLVYCILTHSALSLSYAALGLRLWFEKMIPALLPFMILSGIMVRLRLTEKLSMIIYPLIRPCFRVRKNVCYAMLTGFLCGFPMGAKTADDLYSERMITRREAEYLLAFCNNIGPVYFCGFVLPLLGRRLVFPYLFGMYGIPLLYGLILRHTIFRDLPEPDVRRNSALCSRPSRGGQAELTCCEEPGKPARGSRLFGAIDDSIRSSVQSILNLGGYMILFNLMNLLPHLLYGRVPAFLSPLLEISGGLILLQARLPLYSLLALSFGGLSCMAQTYSCIGQSGFSIGGYLLHKLVLTLLTALYYVGWLLLSPSSFLL